MKAHSCLEAAEVIQQLASLVSLSGHVLAVLLVLQNQGMLHILQHLRAGPPLFQSLVRCRQQGLQPACPTRRQSTIDRQARGVCCYDFCCFKQKLQETEQAQDHKNDAC